MTGHIEDEYVKTAIDAGMNQVFSKPLRADLLADILNQIDFFDKNEEAKEEHGLPELDRKHSEIQQELVNMYKNKTYYQMDPNVS